MEDISYHFLTPENAAFVQAADVFDFAVKPDQLSAFMAYPQNALVFAQIGDRIVGFASGTMLLHPDKDPIMFINEVGVEEDTRRQGIATNLCHHLLQWAREQGCNGTWLATEGDNTAARTLYRSLAARETLDVVVYDWDGVMDD